MMKATIQNFKPFPLTDKFRSENSVVLVAEIRHQRCRL